MAWDWGKKLGTAPAAPRPSNNLPRGVGVQTSQFVVATTPGGAPQPYPGQVGDPAELGYDPGVHIPAGEAMRSWRGDPSGGARETATLGNCPQCHSPRYFSRSQEAKMMANGQMAVPIPECFECGYPRQQGTLGIGAKTQGAVRGARQGAMMPLAIDKPQAKV